MTRNEINVEWKEAVSHFYKSVQYNDRGQLISSVKRLQRILQEIPTDLPPALELTAEEIETINKEVGSLWPKEISC